MGLIKMRRALIIRNCRAASVGLAKAVSWCVEVVCLGVAAASVKLTGAARWYVGVVGSREGAACAASDHPTSGATPSEWVGFGNATIPEAYVATDWLLRKVAKSLGDLNGAVDAAVDVAL